MYKNKLLSKNKKGFTLIELLVVVAVIALLAAIVLFSIDGIRAKSRDTKRVADIKSIQEGLALYHSDNQAYPIYDGYITGSDMVSTDLKSNGNMNAVPIDPLNGDLGGVTYKYHYQSTQGNNYVIEYYLETDSIKDHSAGLNTARP